MLTKNPGGLKRIEILSDEGKGGYEDLPRNLVWGISLTGNDPVSVERLRMFNEVRHPAERVVISYEPVLSPLPELPPVESGMGWLIIGAQTGPGAIPPRLGWVHAACEISRAAGWRVWVKDNITNAPPPLGGVEWPREQLPFV